MAIHATKNANGRGTGGRNSRKGANSSTKLHEWKGPQEDEEQERQGKGIQTRDGADSGGAEGGGSRKGAASSGCCSSRTMRSRKLPRVCLSPAVVCMPTCMPQSIKVDHAGNFFQALPHPEYMERALQKYLPSTSFMVRREKQELTSCNVQTMPAVWIRTSMVDVTFFATCQEA